MKRPLLALPFIFALLSAPPALAGMVPTAEALAKKATTIITAMAPGGATRDFERKECHRSMPLEAHRVAQAARDTYCNCVADFVTRSGQGGTAARPHSVLWDAAKTCGFSALIRTAGRK